jgi:hypothetical protein
MTAERELIPTDPWMLGGFLPYRLLLTLYGRIFAKIGVDLSHFSSQVRVAASKRDW